MHLDSFEQILAQHEALMSGNGQKDAPMQLLEQKFAEPFSPSQLNGVLFEEDVTTFLNADFTSTEQQAVTMASEPLLEEGPEYYQGHTVPSLEAFDIPSLPPLEPDFDLVVDGMPEWQFDPDPKPLPLRISPSPRKRRKSNTPSDRDDTPKPSKVQASTETFRPPPKSLALAAFAAPSSALRVMRKYTKFFRDLRRDPTALARRVIANAWRTNWGRLGSLSWWVLGLFLGSPTPEEEPEQSSNADDDFNWHYYSAEASKARRLGMSDGPGPALEEPQSQSTGCHGHAGSRPRLRTKPSKVTFNSPDDDPDRKTPRRCKRCTPDSEQQTFGRKIKLWARFSFAIVLAVGGAVKDGPAAMMADCRDDGPRYQHHHRDGCREYPEQERHHSSGGSSTPSSDEGSDTLDAGHFALNGEIYEFSAPGIHCGAADTTALDGSEASWPEYDLSSGI